MAVTLISSVPLFLLFGGLLSRHETFIKNQMMTLYLHNYIEML